MEKQVHHVVTRPGRIHGDPDVQIPVAEDLASVPGIPLRETDVSFYSRVRIPRRPRTSKKPPIGSGSGPYTSQKYSNTVRYHDEINEPLIDAAAVSGRLDRRLPRTGEDVTEDHPPQGASVRFWGSRFHPVRLPLNLHQQEALGEIRARHLSWRWNKTTCKRSPSPAWTPSLPTSAPMRSKAP